MKVVFSEGGSGQALVTTDTQIGSEGMNVLTVHQCRFLMGTQNSKLLTFPEKASCLTLRLFGIH